jgi:hypothetical protein
MTMRVEWLLYASCALLTVVQVGQALAALAPDEVVYSAEYVPDAIEYGGRVVLHLRNTTDAELTINAVELDGESVGRIWLTDQSFLGPEVRDEYIGVSNERVAWYRVYPNPLPPGDMAEVLVRLQPEAAGEASHEVAVSFDNHELVSVTIESAEPTLRLQYVGIGPQLETLYIYARLGPNSDAAACQIEIDGHPIDCAVQPVYDDQCFARVALPEAWGQGSFHVVAVRREDELAAAMIRALPSPPPLAIMGNLSESEAEQYAQHLFDAHLAFTPANRERYDRLAAFGLRGAYPYSRKLKPDEKKYEPVYYDVVEPVAAIMDHPALWAYFLEDEPDGRYHRTNLPRLSIPRDVERANQFCRVLDPLHPIYLQIDHGSYPRNLYLYGQIPDYLCTHAYPFGGDIIERTRDHALHTEAASRPRPFIYLCEGYCKNDHRQFDPDEMRVEVYTALACGAKALQWYPAHSDRGLLKHPVMWNAVGRMNGILHQVLPLLAIGTPVGEPEVDGGEFLASAILCGDRAMVVALVNRDCVSTPESFTLTPATDVRVRVALPELLNAQGAALMTFDGPVDLAAEIEGSNVSFSLEEVQAGAVVVIYADEDVLAEMRRIQAERVAPSFVPMPAQ